MPVARFSYTNGNSVQPTDTPMPFLPLILRNGVQEIAVLGLLDTGAAINLLPYWVGRQLGFVWEQQRMSIPLAGNIKDVPARAVIAEAVVASFAPVRLAFAWAQSDDVRVLLGQTNFFAEFDACFFGSRAEFEIAPGT